MAKGRNLLFSFVSRFKTFVYGDKSNPYGKPRRIIQNQVLIVVLFVLAVLSPSWVTILLFRLFMAFPSLVPLSLITWIVVVALYIFACIKNKGSDYT